MEAKTEQTNTETQASISHQQTRPAKSKQHPSLKALRKTGSNTFIPDISTETNCRREDPNTGRLFRFHPETIYS